MTELVRTYKLTDSGAWGWVTEEAEGGGGSLPSWWTVDSTPGSESVEFAGAVTIQAAIGKNPLDVIFPTGSAKRIYFETEEGAAWRWSADGGAIALRYANVDGDPLFDVAAAGAVTISPSGTGNADGLRVIAQDFNASTESFRVGRTNRDGRFTVQGFGRVSLWPDSDIDPSDFAFEVLDAGGNNDVFVIGAAGGIGFFGTTPAAKPTGVAVTAGGIHAALVTLGLIAA